MPPGEQLLRPYFGMHRFEWESDDSVEFHLPHGKMVSLLHDCRFEIEGLVEIRPSAGSGASYDWARRWPSEEAWLARKR